MEAAHAATNVHNYILSEETESHITVHIQHKGDQSNAPHVGGRRHCATFQHFRSCNYWRSNCHRIVCHIWHRKHPQYTKVEFTWVMDIGNRWRLSGSGGRQLRSWAKVNQLQRPRTFIAEHHIAWLNAQMNNSTNTANRIVLKCGHTISIYCIS